MLALVRDLPTTTQVGRTLHGAYSAGLLRHAKAQRAVQCWKANRRSSHSRLQRILELREALPSLNLSSVLAQYPW